MKVLKIISLLILLLVVASCGKGAYGVPKDATIKVTISRSIEIEADPSMVVFAKEINNNSGGFLSLTCPCYLASGSDFDSHKSVAKIPEGILKIEALKGSATNFEIQNINQK